MGEKTTKKRRSRSRRETRVEKFNLFSLHFLFFPSTLALPPPHPDMSQFVPPRLPACSHLTEGDASAAASTSYDPATPTYWASLSAHGVVGLAAGGIVLGFGLGALCVAAAAASSAARRARRSRSKVAREELKKHQQQQQRGGNSFDFVASSSVVTVASSDEIEISAAAATSSSPNP